jgi:hypothetical protein
MRGNRIIRGIPYKYGDDGNRDRCGSDAAGVLTSTLRVHGRLNRRGRITSAIVFMKLCNWDTEQTD